MALTRRSPRSHNTRGQTPPPPGPIARRPSSADSPVSVAVAHVQERELRDAGPDLGRHEADPDETFVREGAQAERARREGPRALGALMRDRVLALPVAAPGRRAPVHCPLLQAGAALHVRGRDAFGPVDLADPIEIGGVGASIGNLGSLHPMACAWRSVSRSADSGLLCPNVVPSHRVITSRSREPRASCLAGR